MKRLVNFFHRSTCSTARAMLNEKQELLKLLEHKLITDCPTGWNSSYDMLEGFLEQQAAVMATLLFPTTRQTEKDLGNLS